MLEGGTVRNTYAGFSNMLGLMAWDLVKSGFTGEADGIGLRLRRHCSRRIRSADHDGSSRHPLGDRAQLFQAACGVPIAIAGRSMPLGSIIAKAGGRLDPAMIEAIEVETYVWAAQLDHPEPANMLAGQVLDAIFAGDVHRQRSGDP